MESGMLRSALYVVKFPGVMDVNGVFWQLQHFLDFASTAASFQDLL